MFARPFLPGPLARHLPVVNHLFDVSTPGGGNYEAAVGEPTGPPAPPRDGREDIGDLMECFTF
jgi:hypothetical protein